MNKYGLNELKIAVINEDFNKLEELSKKTPSFSSIEEAKEILKYIEMAKEIINKEKNRLSKDMREIKKLKKFRQNQLKKSSGGFIA